MIRKKISAAFLALGIAFGIALGAGTASADGGFATYDGGASTQSSNPTWEE